MRVVTSHVGLSALGHIVSGMWQYLLHDWDPDSGVSMQAWAQDLADKGWVAWAGPGCWTTHEGRSLWRVSLRREPELLRAELRAKGMAREGW